METTATSLNGLHNEWFTEKERRVVSLIEKCSPSTKTVADLGAGPNSVVNTVKCAKKITVDFNPVNSPDVVCDLDKGIELPSASADICVASEVLEHLYHSVNFVREVGRVLREGGYLIIVVPNICSLSYRMKFLFGELPMWAARADQTYQQFGAIGAEGGHVRDYTFKELESLLMGNGFDIVDRSFAHMPYTKKLRATFLDELLPATFAEKIVLRAQKRRLANGHAAKCD